MSNYISINAKYYKHQESLRDEKHVLRKFFDDVNVFDDLSKDNFSFEFMSYEKAYENHAKSINKKVRENANTLIDCVVSFSREQFQEILDSKDSKQNLALASKKLMEEIKKEYGFTPLSINFHLDEGHYENGEFKNNYHAHMLFYNYDFDKKCAPLRKFRNNKKAFSKMQDIAGECFSSLNFKRGISKKITKKEHMEKREFVENALKEKEEELLKAKQKIEDLKFKNDKLNQMIIDKRDYVNNLTINEKDKSTFVNLKNVVESKRFENAELIYKDMSNHTYFRQITRMIDPFLNFFKKIYNSLHHLYLNSPSKFEIEEKKVLVQKVENVMEDLKNNKKKRGKVNNFPKLTR